MNITNLDNFGQATRQRPAGSSDRATIATSTAQLPIIFLDSLNEPFAGVVKVSVLFGLRFHGFLNP
jgi:hypothetical protein